MSADRSVSVLTRPLTRSHSAGKSSKFMHSRIASERLLYRLSVFLRVGDFALKNTPQIALLFGAPLRPTKYFDLLGFGVHGADTGRNRLTAICAIDADRFEPDTMRAPALESSREPIANNKK